MDRLVKVCVKIDYKNTDVGIKCVCMLYVTELATVRNFEIIIHLAKSTSEFVAVKI
jgi:hypothetical protein